MKLWSQPAALPGLHEQPRQCTHHQPGHPRMTSTSATGTTTSSQSAIQAGSPAMGGHSVAAPPEMVSKAPEV
jgi:hypothetical protein